MMAWNIERGFADIRLKNETKGTEIINAGYGLCP